MIAAVAGVNDERTQAQAVSLTWDKPHEDVSFLVLRGPDEGERFLVKPPGGVIGREPGAAVQTRDPNVSRRHALIEFSPDGRVMITDLGSRNGIYVNGVQISRSELFDGNHIQISNDTVMRARFQDPAETQLLEELHGFAIRDKLTSLPNRRYVIDRMRQELAYARRYGDKLSVALMDIDDFKKVNDVDGQQGGDALLKGIAVLVRANVRQEDVVARYGGDELVILQRSTTAAECKALGERLCQEVRSRTFKTGDVPIRATVTIGVACEDYATPAPAPAKGQGVQVDINLVNRMLDRADAALFEAKQAGKDRVGCHGEQ